MSPKIITPGATVDLVNVLLLVGLILGGILIGVAVERFVSKRYKKRQNGSGWRWNRPGSWSRNNSKTWMAKPDAVAPKEVDAADQLRIVMGATFTIQPLLNKSEARVFKELDRIVISCNPEWQVMAQVSMGEILRSTDAKAYGCINSKRVDLLLMEQDCRPRHAIEYQGGAHHQGTAAARDAIKKEALRRAGIGYHEVVAGHTTPSDLKRLVEKLVDSSAGGA